MKKSFVQLFSLAMVFMSCHESATSHQQPFQLVTVDPGHFHAALVQKTMYPAIDSTVYVYGPAGNDMQLHLDRINSYNNRKENPTHWNEKVYAGADFFEKMIKEKKGNLVVLSGNNQKKTDYILAALQNGFHVLADKPMAIDANGFEKLKEAFAVAEKNKRLLYDIMTERFEINTILQRELSRLPEVFGTLEKGSIDYPAITKESVHHFYKYVSGAVLTRPAWFLDASQQGEGLVDVMTHLVDLVQWECFPETIIDYTKDIQVLNAKGWSTAITKSEFSAITKLQDFPSFLQPNIKDTVLHVFSNGELNYKIKGVHAKTAVIWNYKAPDGTGDTHYSIMRGTKANLVIRQGKEENYQPVLYIEPIKNDGAYEQQLTKAVIALNKKYAGIQLAKSKQGWIINIPAALKEGHEAHFAGVTENYLRYLSNGSLPAWEVPNMLAKYYTTTTGLTLALKNRK
jgi:predicted dehydrogenase